MDFIKSFAPFDVKKVNSCLTSYQAFWIYFLEVGVCVKQPTNYNIKKW